MKSRFILMPMILAATAANADALRTSPSQRADAQEQARALLSSAWTRGTVQADVAAAGQSGMRVSADAQAQAAALLSRPRVPVAVASDGTVPRTLRASSDAQAQAGFLLGRAGAK